MLNTKLSRVNSFANTNSVLVDTSWNTYKNKGLFDKVVSFYKQEADAIISKEEIEKWYYISAEKWLIKLKSVFYKQSVLCNSFDLINSKQDVINTNVWKILKCIESRWKNVWYSKLIFSTYLDKWYITIDNIKQSLIKYFGNTASEAYKHTQKPISLIPYPWLVDSDHLNSVYNTDIFTAEYDIDRDMEKYMKEILAYSIKNNLLLDEEIEDIKETLKAWWDDLKYFYKIHLDENLLDRYLEQILKDN